jgi:hypothetical protein
MEVDFCAILLSLTVLPTDWSEGNCATCYSCSAVMVLVIRCLTLLEDIQIIGSCCLYVFCYYHILSYSLVSIFYQYMVVFLFNTVIYVFLLLCVCILTVWLCIFIVPTGTLQLSWLRFYRAFSSAVRQMPVYNSSRRGTARSLPKCLCRSVYCLCVNVYCTTATGWQRNCS